MHVGEVCVRVCMCVYMYVCVYVCVCLCACVNVCRMYMITTIRDRSSHITLKNLPPPPSPPPPSPPPPPPSIQALIRGHMEGELWGLATSPTDDQVFVSASDDCTVRLWDIASKVSG